jgi:hypothetical protein
MKKMITIYILNIISIIIVVYFHIKKKFYKKDIYSDWQS